MWLVALARNSWRQLTSMRTALVLLFLLAVAAIPGSVLPQRSINLEKVNRYFVDHPDAAPVLDRLSAFDVYSSPWFSAIYLLLFTSLVGCIVPRLREHAQALRRPVPDAPRRLERLGQHTGPVPVAGAPPQVAERLRERLRGGGPLRRWSGWRTVLRGHDDGSVTVSAEKGYLKETGNLLFHTSLIAVLIGVAIGSWYGWHGNRLLVAGPDGAFCTSLQQFDDYGLGARVDAAGLPRFCLEMTDFRASYLDSGQPESFAATVQVSDVDGKAAAGRSRSFSVNSPLRLAGANVYLLGHGYAPVVRYTDRFGRTQTTVAPFLPTDDLLTSEGVATFPDANVDPATGRRDPMLQVAFQGLYLPTAPDTAPFVRSVYPAEDSPALMLMAYRGDLGLDAGIPGSVYTLDQRQITAGRLSQVGQATLLRVGESMTLDDGTKVEFLGTRQWATISVRHDPGERIVLVSVVALLAGLMLSLTGKRRRVWLRVAPAAAAADGGCVPGGDGSDPPDGAGRAPAGAADQPDGAGTSSMVTAAGLARTDYPGFAEEFHRLVVTVLPESVERPPSTITAPTADRSLHG